MKKKSIGKRHSWRDLIDHDAELRDGLTVKKLDNNLKLKKTKQSTLSG